MTCNPRNNGNRGSFLFLPDCDRDEQESNDGLAFAGYFFAPRLQSVVGGKHFDQTTTLNNGRDSVSNGPQERNMSGVR